MIHFAVQQRILVFIYTSDYEAVLQCRLYSGYLGQVKDITRLAAAPHPSVMQIHIKNIYFLYSEVDLSHVHMFCYPKVI